MDSTVLIVFILVYLGMIFGRFPGLVLDRTGIALLGAIALMVFEKVTPVAAWDAIDVPTMALLFGLMVISAQFRLGGFYAWSTRRLAAARVSPEVLLALLILLSGVLSAVLANDIVCLAMTPVLIEGCAKRNLPPLPFLLALACSANIGSAATLIGNPQNMLIGQSLGLSFSGYLLDSAVPSVLGLAATWWVFRKQVHGTWTGAGAPPDAEAPPFNARQTTKGFVVIGIVMAAFLFTDWPRELVALGGAGVLLLSRRMHSRSMLALVDWQLLVLFAGLFIVNHVLQTSGNLAAMMDGLTRTGVDLREPVPLFAGTVILSNLVSNVPATMLLLPVATHPFAGPILALASTFAGNLFIVGSIANIIVVEQADRMNVRITFAQHVRAGVPLTLLTLLFAAGWLWLRAAMAGG